MKLLSESDASRIYDDIRNDGSDMSLEGLAEFTSANISSYDDVVDLRNKFVDTMKKKSEKLASEGLVYVEYVEAPTKFIEVSAEESSIVIIDEELFYNFLCGNSESKFNFIKEIDSIPENHLLSVIVDTGRADIDFVTLDAGIVISNVIRRAKCTKVFHTGSEANIVDLMIGMCCDEQYVSDVSSISIIRADNGDRISRYMVPVYKNIVQSIYRYWMEKGLFTPDEVTNLFKSEANNSIQLLSEEIKVRLQK